MPLYPYECSKCKHKEDKLFSYSTIPESKIRFKCTACGKKKLVRQFGIPNIDDGPKSFGTQSERNIKKFGDKTKKKPMTNVEKLSRASPEKKLKYIETGEI